MFYCKYCNKEVRNKGALINHENACNLNPNKVKNPNRIGNGGHSKGHITWNKGLTKENNESLKHAGLILKNKYLNGELIPSFLGKHHTEETKKNVYLKNVNNGY